MRTCHLAGSVIALGLMGTLASPALAETRISTPPPSALSVGPYAGFGGGLNIQRDTDFSGPGVNGTVDSNLGWAGLLSLGYRWQNGLRGEIEGGYRRNNVDEIEGCGACGSDGFTQAWSAMANLLYDFDFGWPVRPYIGAGAGAAKVRAGGIGPVPGTSINDSDWAFAYQGIAGVSYQVARPVELFAEYRYFATEGLDIEAATAGGTVQNDNEYRNHTIMAGLRWYFGAQPAAPVVPAVAPTRAEPAAPVPRSYTVFFDFDRATLTDQGREVVATAAANAKSGQIATIDATGYADRSGPAAYNMDLSRRRAENVKSELVRLGVPANDIVVAWKGENENLVPTADGVREPQNRRVTVVYR